VPSETRGLKSPWGRLVKKTSISLGGAKEMVEGKEPGTIIVPGLTYMGNGSCSAANCHGGDEAVEQSGQMIGDEFWIWEEEDPHAKSFEILSNDVSKSIASKLGIEDASASEACLSCHAVTPPEGMRGPDFALEDGNSCESCHGPAEKWRQPHAEAGWTAAQRADLGADGLLSEWGLIDTSNVAYRAVTCANCHVNIEQEMVDAGHPPLEFELSGYNWYDGRHWDPKYGEMMDAKMWATGQAAGAMLAEGSLKKLYEMGVGVAKKHFGADTIEGLAGASYTPAKCAAAAKDLAAMAGEATNDAERRIIVSGVTGLVIASFDGPDGEGAPDAVFDLSDEAMELGDGWQETLSEMAGMAGG